MTRRELLETMPPSEFKQWVAYFSLEDEEYKQKLEHKVALEKSSKKSDEERAMEIRAMLMGLGE
tara:strand:- start:74 stop:265 length:192 start_codon:yes stop_codon:yes gene_type:complete